MKTFITILIVLVLGAGIYLVSRGRGDQTASPTPTATVSFTTSPESTTVPSATPSATVTIAYTENGYNPSQITVRKGDTVVFENKSKADMWPASAKHPVHTDYPEAGTCFNGVFTGCKVTPGGTFSMKFNTVGAWGFHDHLKPSNFGKITVAE